MFKHEKMLMSPVEVEKPNPQYAALLQEQLGGGKGAGSHGDGGADHQPLERSRR